KTHLFEPRRYSRIRCCLEREIESRHDVPGTHQHGALNHVVQLPHVPRPQVLSQRIERLGREAHDRPPVTLAMQFQKVLGQHGNVFDTIAQRRQANLDRVETEQQVLTKTSLRHFRMKIRICRRQQTHIHFLRLRRSDALKLTGLQYAQQLRLKIQWYVPNLVEKQCAAIGKLETPDPIALRISERTAHVSEQFTLKYAFSERACV